MSILEVMIIQAISFIILIVFSLPIFGQSQHVMKKKVVLGDSSVELTHQFENLESDILYLNVHEDEQTSITAIETHQKSNSINFAFLTHNKTRRIHYKVKSKFYSIDPNRIYTAKGRRKTIEPLKRFNYKPRKIAKLLATELLAFISKYKIIVTLHNNTDVNYSIKSYEAGGDESENTKRVFVTSSWDPDDFVYTTDEKYYNYLKEADVNVILQDNRKYVNDGSLSVYCGKNNIPYINIEAQLGHLEEQIKLIQIVSEMLVKV